MQSFLVGIFQFHAIDLCAWVIDVICCRRIVADHLQCKSSFDTVELQHTLGSFRWVRAQCGLSAASVTLTGDAVIFRRRCISSKASLWSSTISRARLSASNECSTPSLSYVTVSGAARTKCFVIVRISVVFFFSFFFKTDQFCLVEVFVFWNYKSSFYRQAFFRNHFVFELFYFSFLGYAVRLENMIYIVFCYEQCEYVSAIFENYCMLPRFECRIFLVPILYFWRLFFVSDQQRQQDLRVSDNSGLDYFPRY